MRLSPFALVGALAFSVGARAEEVAYVEVSSELDDGKPATYVYNLLDGRDTTVWCSKRGPTKETIVFGFEKPQKVTHIDIVVAAKKGEGIDTSKQRARTLWVSDGEVRREIPVKDLGDVQELKLDPAIQAQRIIIDIPAMRGVDGNTDAPLCIADITLKNGSRTYSGEETAKKVRALPTPARRLLHSWVDDVGAPERTLVFSLDGTFHYAFEPLMEGKPVKLSGKWSTAGREIAFETRGKKTTMKTRLTKIDDGGKGSTELMLEGDGPHESMNAAFRIAPARLE